MDFFCKLYEWKFNFENEALSAFFNLADHLLLLAQDAQTQEKNTPDCPYCELSNGYISAREKFKLCCGELLKTENVMSVLAKLDLCFEQMHGEEVRCFDSKIFYLHQWGELRELAIRALKALQWCEIEPVREQLDTYSKYN